MARLFYVHKAIFTLFEAYPKVLSTQSVAKDVGTIYSGRDAT